jgi:hypothetical protein
MAPPVLLHRCDRAPHTVTYSLQPDGARGLVVSIVSTAAPGGGTLVHAGDVPRDATLGRLVLTPLPARVYVTCASEQVVRVHDDGWPWTDGAHAEFEAALMDTLAEADPAAAERLRPFVRATRQERAGAARWP